MDCIIFSYVDLAKGDSLAAFHWNTGGTWTNRPWDQDLPTDSQVSKFTLTHRLSSLYVHPQIVMHLLCSYMDAHLPPNPRHPNGRVFSSQYFLKCPHKPTDKKADICIYQSQSHPPHYQVLYTTNSFVYLMHTQLIYFEMPNLKVSFIQKRLKCF